MSDHAVMHKSDRTNNTSSHDSRDRTPHELQNTTAMNNEHNTDKNNGERESELHAGSERRSGPCTYRTKDGKAWFSFRYVEHRDGTIEVDILSMPEYGGRDVSLLVTHRMFSSRGGYMISQLHTDQRLGLDHAKAISMLWSEMTWTYIQTGRQLDDQFMDGQEHGRSSTACPSNSVPDEEEQPAADTEGHPKPH